MTKLKSLFNEIEVCHVMRINWLYLKFKSLCYQIKVVIFEDQSLIDFTGLIW